MDGGLLVTIWFERNIFHWLTRRDTSICVLGLKYFFVEYLNYPPSLFLRKYPSIPYTYMLMMVPEPFFLPSERMTEAETYCIKEFEQSHRLYTYKASVGV